MEKKRGLALSIEALVVIGSILILTSIITIKGPSFFEGGRISRAETDVTALGGYVSEYSLEIGSYPDTLDALTRENGQYGPWISKVPTDPWGNTYQYKKTADKFVVYSFGPDKVDSGSSAENGIAKKDIGVYGK